MSLRSQSPALDGWRTIDERYADLADSVPGFGGLFYDASGRLTVYAKNPATFDGPTRQRFIALRQSQRGGQPIPGDGDLQVLPGRYDFRELLTIYRGTIIPAIPSIEGVTTSDIDDVRHRIVIGVSDGALIGKARLRIAVLRLPEGLVDVETVPLARLNLSLADSLRPVPGGAAVTWGSPSSPCTLGYNLIRHVGGAGDTAATARFFVTNSHCTSQRNTLDYTQIRQFGYFIGAEIGDPAAFTNSYTSACPVTFVCRWADAALFQYDSAAHTDHGRIAFPSLNSLVFTSYLNVTAVQPPEAGYSVNMIGSASGRRSGTVQSVCVDVWGITGWTSGRLLCQGKSNYVSTGGDSGAPVITAFGDGTAWATGLHWGSNVAGDRWFSSMDAVLWEFYQRLSGNPYLSPVVYP